MYPSPYIVLSEHGYTKHFYAGSERIATLIGDGGLQFDYVQIDSQRQSEIMHAFGHLEDDIQYIYHSDCTPNENIDGQFVQELQYRDGFVAPIEVDVSWNGYLFVNILYHCQDFFGVSNDVYFTHPDHLGSASWITDHHGEPVQYIHYAPYGEFIANQQAHDYDERFKFTGKERDAESGYDYFGARHYDHRKGIWHSVDPLADKYIHQSPYLYCNGNPVMLVDPDGRNCRVKLEGNTAIVYAKIYTNEKGLLSAKKAVEIWNNKSDGIYIDPEGKIYNVIFKISVKLLKGKHGKDLRNAVALMQDPQANTYEVVAAFTDNSIPRNVAGHTTRNSAVEVRENHADDNTGAHEVGHLLMQSNTEGEEHLGGIMSSTLVQTTEEINQETIQKIIESNLE